MNIDDKIKQRMDRLQREMEANAHLTETLAVMELYYSVRKFWSRLSDEDRDYLHAVEYALAENVQWKLP
jgi:hypothetical protein